jgi:esterase/lipase
MTPPADFAAAVAAIEEIAARERADPSIDPRCLSFVLHHGGQTDRAVVMFHGFTNCPRQFAPLANLFFAQGYNVYVPRLPRHGLLDKLTSEPAGLTIEELIACATQSAQLGGQLARDLSVLGLSAGATMVAWLAQTRAVHHALAISPFFSVAHIPALLEPALAGGLMLAPNLEMWWDPRVKEHAEPSHAYPRFATHALARCLQLGERVRRLAQDTAPLAAHSTLVLNAKDPAIDIAAARGVWTLWRKHGAATGEYVFENLDVRHDIIEPTTYPDAPRLVYPVILQLMER